MTLGLLSNLEGHGGVVMLCRLFEPAQEIPVGPCLYERGKVEKNSRVCLDCLRRRPKREEKPKKKKSRIDKRYLEKWVNDLFIPPKTFEQSIKFKGDFYDGSLDKIRKMLKVENSDEKFEELLSSYSFQFAEKILFEIRTVPLKKLLTNQVKLQRHYISRSPLSSVKDEDKRRLHRLEEELALLPNKKLNRPLYWYVAALLTFYERRIGKTVKRISESYKKAGLTRKTRPGFYKFIDYCIKSMRLSNAWPEGSIDKAIQRVISARKKDPSISIYLGSTNDRIGSYLFDSLYLPYIYGDSSFPNKVDSLLKARNIVPRGDSSSTPV